MRKSRIMSLSLSPCHKKGKKKGISVGGKCVATEEGKEEGSGEAIEARGNPRWEGNDTQVIHVRQEVGK